MTENLFDKIRSKVLGALEGLNPHLTYHSVGHTLDVVKEAERIAREEGISDDRELFLIKIAALYHDTGFLQTYAGHEEASCALFMKDTADLDLTENEKEAVKGMIMATKVPQQPHNLIEKIICDADLDYLGRADFPEIGQQLKKEFLHYKIVRDDSDWERLQLKFLEAHRYHTPSSQRLREPVKQENYRKLL
jgi:predicted metal-dependent HD superfamily phosphohydrolase